MNFHHKDVNIAICMEVAKSSNYDFKKNLRKGQQGEQNIVVKRLPSNFTLIFFFYKLYG